MRPFNIIVAAAEKVDPVVAACHRGEPVAAAEAEVVVVAVVMLARGF